MSDKLATLTAALVGQLETTFEHQRPSRDLDDAVCAYVAYWRRMGASSTSIVEFTQRLIERTRPAEARNDPARAREVDAIGAEVLARCLTLASAPRH